MNWLCLCELQVLRYNLIVPFGRQICGLKWEKEMDRVNEWSIYLANVYVRVGRDEWLEWTCTQSIILVKARAILQLVEKISLESSFFFFFFQLELYMIAGLCSLLVYFCLLHHIYTLFANTYLCYLVFV